MSLMILRLNSIFAPLIICVIALSCALRSQSLNEDLDQIKVNQIGYLTHGIKQAVVAEPDEDAFEIIDGADRVLYRGTLLASKYWELSGEEVAIADFSKFNIPGRYRIKSSGSISRPFVISASPYTTLIKGSIKSYYYNRASSALDPAHSGNYQRGFSHPDTTVYIHASAASEIRPAGTKIATPFGWYDAGDYNKYVVNSGITLYTLLLTYEQNKTFFDTLTWSIPESNNQMADLMDEILWNVRWMESMQDPEDGGVYHKTTTASFEGFVEASEATGKRYVVAKSTAATLDFAAVMAKLSVIMRAVDQQYADELLRKAELAWDWAEKNPNNRYKNPKAGSDADPPISTGEYGDSELRDEFFWAAAELYSATLKTQYADQIDFDAFDVFRTPGWPNVETLGLITLASAQTKVDGMLKKTAADRLMALAEKLTKDWMNAPYKITLNHFTWGSNAVILNQALVLTNAYRFFGNKEFFDAALSGLDYVLGRNATNYCFVTGFGSLSPMHVHHRQSAADSIEEPIPGMLVGGPNPNNVNQDCGKSKYPSLLPAKCYIDATCSYSTNEVAINWNAPLVYLASTLQCIYQNDFE